MAASFVRGVLPPLALPGVAAAGTGLTASPPPSSLQVLPARSPLLSESLPGPSAPAGGSPELQGPADRRWGGLEARPPWDISSLPVSPFGFCSLLGQHLVVGHRSCLGMSQRKWRLSSILKLLEFFRR